MYRIIPILFCFAATSAFLHAHELDAKVTMAAPAVVVHAAYGGTEPVPFAKVQVFAPASATEEFQSGRTDARGYFSFVPDGGGDWKVVLDDEEGHRNTVTVTVPSPFEAAAQAAGPASPSRLERVVLGLAILFGLTGFWYGFKARQGRPAASS